VEQGDKLLGRVKKVVTSPEEYKKGRWKEVTLPSTLPNGEHPVFRIRKLPARLSIELVRMLGLSLSPDMDPEAFEKLVSEEIRKPRNVDKLTEFIEKVLVACVVEPRITTDPNEKGAIYIDDLDPEDQVALIEAIWEYAGLTKEGSEERNL